ncbi:hypothetical protein Peur_063779 [Populus x canadensis]
MFSAVTCYGLVSGRIRIYKMHLPEFRNMVSSRTVEAPCSFNEDTFPPIVSEKRRLLTRGCRIGSIISVLVDVEAIVDQECVYHERIVRNEICRAMKEAMQQQLNPNHYWRTDIEGLEKPVIQEGDIMSH